MVSVLIGFLNSCAIKLAGHGGYKGEEPGLGGTVNIAKIPIKNNWYLNGIGGFDTYKHNSGYDTYFKVGVQGRRITESSPFWFGSELGYINDVTTHEDYFWNSDPNGNAFSLGLLGGSLLPFETLDVSIFSRLEYVHFGGTEDGSSFEKSFNNNNTFGIYLGLEITLPFFQ